MPSCSASSYYLVMGLDGPQSRYVLNWSNTKHHHYINLIRSKLIKIFQFHKIVWHEIPIVIWFVPLFLFFSLCSSFHFWNSFIWVSAFVLCMCRLFNDNHLNGFETQFSHSFMYTSLLQWSVLRKQNLDECDEWNGKNEENYRNESVLVLVRKFLHICCSKAFLINCKQFNLQLKCIHFQSTKLHCYRFQTLFLLRYECLRLDGWHCIAPPNAA